MSKRVIIIVLDSVGIGALPDAGSFGDAGADTVGHLLSRRNLKIPNLTSLGLRKIQGTSFVTLDEKAAVGCYGKCAEVGLAKDTTSGHWEMAGYIRPEPFRTFPNGFPSDLIEEFQKRIGREIIGNEVASGTEIISRLGDDHVATGRPIVYTSADSVFQIACHEEVVPLETLYQYSQIAREMLTGDCAVGRVIARPFTGSTGHYSRTEHRRDYAVAPEEETILDRISSHGLSVVAIGKIEDIFCHRGITKSIHTTNNHDGIEETIQTIISGGDGLVFTNLVDFDMLYGHRNDAEGYSRALEYFDRQLPSILSALHSEDLLIITSDHGCDPLFPGTDHTREYIPVLVYGSQIDQNADLGIRESFADIAATVVEYLELPSWHIGQSFCHLLGQKG